MSWFKKHRNYIIILLVFNLFFWAKQSKAQILAGVPCISSGNCTLCNMLQVVINIGTFIQGIVGSICLLFFVYGGFVWLTSGGAQEKVKKGREIITNSIIGMLIVLLAYFIVMTIINVVSGTTWDWSTYIKCS